MPDTSVKSLDVSWLGNEKWNSLSEEERKRFAIVTPNFVLELRSESDELKAKMEKWLKNGVQLGWLIDIKNEETYIYRLNQEPEKIPFAENLSGEDVLKNLTIKVKTIFENVV